MAQWIDCGLPPVAEREVSKNAEMEQEGDINLRNDAGHSHASEEDLLSPDRTHRSVPPTAEDIDRWHRHATLENFGKIVTKNARLVFSSETRSRYTNVYVLIIRWEKEDPKLPVSYEIQELCKILGGTYGFHIDVFQIPDKKSHARVSEKINAFVDINDDSKNDLKIVYYAGHSRLSKTKGLVWSSIRDKRRQECSTVTWTGIQKCLEQAESDVLILLDCCSAGVGNSGEGNGVTQLISACAFDVEANGVGHYSFTKALTIELGLFSSQRGFSVEELYQNVYCRAQHHLMQGLENERYPAPIHLHLTRERGLQRTIQLAVRQASRRTSQLQMNPMSSQTSARPRRNSDTKVSEDFQGSLLSMYSTLADSVERPLSSASFDEDMSNPYVPCEDASVLNIPWPQNAPRIHIGIRLDDNMRAEDLSPDYFTDWLRALPAAAREVRVDAGPVSDSSLLLLSLPLSLRPYLPERLVYDLETRGSSRTESRAPTALKRKEHVTVTADSLPAPFGTSLADYLSYPMNLILKKPYSASLHDYKNRLDQIAPQVPVREVGCVSIHDYSGTGVSNTSEKERISNDSDLKDWLGYPEATASSGHSAVKRDPKCRWVFMNANRHHHCLPITSKMLARLLTYHQVMPAYLDFLSSIMPRNSTTDPGYTGFWEQTSFTSSTPNLRVSELGRSGNSFQISYNLKAMNQDSHPSEISSHHWPITQAAIHHQFDLDEGAALWIVTHSNNSELFREDATGIAKIGDTLDTQAFDTTENCFESSLSTHLSICRWSLKNWHSYINQFEEAIEKTSNVATYTRRHLDSLKDYKDKLQEVSEVISANIGVLSSIRDFYNLLSKNSRMNFSHRNQENLAAFVSELDATMQELRSLVTRSKVLIRLASERETLIHHFLHSQATARIEEMNERMMVISQATRKDVTLMGLVTPITLIYLPATFVSTFFPTDILSSANPNAINGNGDTPSLSMAGLQRWLQVTIPLTGATLAAAWVFLTWSHRTVDRNFERTEETPRKGESGMSWDKKRDS